MGRENDQMTLSVKKRNFLSKRKKCTGKEVKNLEKKGEKTSLRRAP